MNTITSFNINYLNNYIFSNNYTSICTNVSSLTDAQIIILPECHYYENDQMRNAWIINQLYRTGDVVLVESPNDESETFHQINKVSRTITIRGWDCPKSDEALHRAKKPLYDLRDRLFNIQGFGDEHRQILSEAIAVGPCQTDESFKKEFLSSLNTFNHLAPNLKKMFVFRKIEVWHEQNGEVGRVIANTFSKRQESLIRKCQQFSTTNNRIFIVAGAAHTLSKDEDEQFFREGVKLLHDYLKDKKFVIFDHARFPTNLLRFDIKLCLILSSIEKTVNKVCSRASRQLLQVVNFDFTCYLTRSLCLNYFHFGNSCFKNHFFAFVNIFQMLRNCGYFEFN